MRKQTLRSILVFSFMFVTILVFSQEIYQDVVTLKSGKIVRGVILEQVSDKYLKIRSRDNKIMKIPMSEIEEISQEAFQVEGLKRELYDPYFMKNKHDYWSFATGLGPSYGGLGLRFQQRMGRILGYGYHASIGVMTGGEGFRSFWGYSLGFKFYPYKSYYVNAQYGSIGIIYQEDVLGNIVNQEALYGPSLLVGGDWFFSQYFGMNAGIGVSFNITHPDVQSAIFTYDIGLMVKFK